MAHGAHSTSCGAGAAGTCWGIWSGPMDIDPVNPCGGPGPSSLPGSRAQNAQPVAGMALTRRLPVRLQAPCTPPYTRPPHDVQCQHGREVEWLVVRCMPVMVGGGWLTG